MTDSIRNWLMTHGFGDTPAEIVSWALIALAVLLLAIICNLIAKKILLTGIAFIIKRSKTKWDDILYRRQVFTRLSHLAPALVVYFTAPIFLQFSDFLQRFAMVYMMIAGLYAFNGFLNAIIEIYRSFEVSRQRPIKGYVQIVKILISIFIIIIALATILGRSPWLLLSGLGALTAVLILVFKDSILGFIASIQLTSNDMVRIGDWIEMPKYGADGDVTDVTLHTVKVQNWDKTITTIPTYALISDSFINWRGMSDSGGRRIKRAIYIDMTSVKFCTSEMLDRFEKYQLLGDYIRAKKQEIAEYNKIHKIDASELINGRNLTNIGTLRAYISAYLRQHPKIHQDMTFLIRHLQPGEFGLPLEIYVFSNDQEWANYEGIQADIFDHILAVIPMFELKVFQRPTGSDVQALGKTDELRSITPD